MNKKICIVIANYYPKISNELIKGALKTLKSKGLRNYKIFKVPGVFEIPFVISKNINKYNGFLALGCVIRGETPHFEFLSRSTINALMHLTITYKKPIGNGIITCHNKKQALARSSKKNNKGKESVNAIFPLLKY